MNFRAQFRRKALDAPTTLSNELKMWLQNWSERWEVERNLGVSSDWRWGLSHKHGSYGKSTGLVRPADWFLTQPGQGLANQDPTPIPGTYSQADLWEWVSSLANKDTERDQCAESFLRFFMQEWEVMGGHR